MRPRELVADVVVEAHVGVLVVGHAPVEQEDVEALVEQELDERVARAQVEDVGPVDQGETSSETSSAPVARRVSRIAAGIASQT